MERNTVVNINEEVNEAVTKILAKYGMTIDRSNIRYSDYEMNFKISATLKSKDGNYKEVDPSLDRRARLAISKTGNVLGHVEHVLGEVWEVRNLGPCKVIDYNTRGKKYPFIVETTGGQRYKVAATSILKPAN